MLDIFNNFILKTDSYKISQPRQYPPGMTAMSSYWESRGGESPFMIPAGLQYILMRHFEGPQVTTPKINYARRLLTPHFGRDDVFDPEPWDYIRRVHAGNLPLLIRAAPEGMIVPTKHALMTIQSTDQQVAWLPTHTETILSHQYHPSTIATRGAWVRHDIMYWLERNGTPAEIDFKFHDFGYRGSTSVESAGIGGLGHLIHFQGTDTLAALEVADLCYAELEAGNSIPAAEHSTITSWGQEHEEDAFFNMLEQNPEGLVAMPTDSYDVYRACEKLLGGDRLKRMIMNRNGVTIARPDSGDMFGVVPRLLAILEDRFGAAWNEKHSKVLDRHIRMIQGDSVKRHTPHELYKVIDSTNYSSDNLNYGSGGWRLQDHNRDTQKCAVKCSAVEVDGVWRDVYKDPITDPGKRSKSGRLALIRDEHGNFKTVREEEAGGLNLLEPVFKDGVILKRHTFAEVRARARQSIDQYVQKD